MQTSFARALVIVLIALPASAKLAPVSLDDMIDRSDVVTAALPTWTQRGEDKRNQAKGRAELKPWGTALKGTPPASLRLRWSAEVHDQPIPDLDLRVLFLKRSADGKSFEPTAYGRSWLKVWHESVRTASLPAALQKNAVEHPDKDMQHVEVIFVDTYPETSIRWPETLVHEVDV